MPQLSNPPPHRYAGSNFDRAAKHRIDGAWLESKRADPSTRVLLMSKLELMVADGDALPRALLPTIAEIGRALPEEAIYLGDEGGVFQTVDAVVDTLNADVVDALPDVGDGVLLVHVAVHRQPVSLFPGCGEHVLELGGWVVFLVGVEANAEDPILVDVSGGERLRCRPGRHVS